MTLNIRAMAPEDTPYGLALSQQVGWPHRLEDWQQSLALGRGLVAEEDGRIVGTTLYWPWGEGSATVGLVIVDPGCQGRGIGRGLLSQTLEALEGYNVRLHATAAGQPLYRQFGFVAVGSASQHQGIVDPSFTAPTPGSGTRLRQGGEQDGAPLTALDCQASGLYRPQLINLLLTQGRVLVLESDTGEPLGFAALRPFGRGHTIGPVVCSNEEDARALVGAFMAQRRGKFVRLDCDSALPFCDWLTRQGLSEVDAPVMMVCGKPWLVKAGSPRTFGLMSQAMG
jgi:predicted N-acetyltransferase YhbS